MSKEFTEYRLYKGGISKGIAICKGPGRWVWAREHGGNEPFRSLVSIKARIEQLCWAQNGKVQATKIEPEGGGKKVSTDERILVLNAAGKEVSDAMWAEYLASPIPDGYEDTGEVRCTKKGELYLNAVSVWSSLPPEAMVEEMDFSRYTHFRIGGGQIKPIDDAPLARRILVRKTGKVSG